MKRGGGYIWERKKKLLRGCGEGLQAGFYNIYKSISKQVTWQQSYTN